MSAVIDATVGIVVIGSFFYLMFMQLKKKHPGLGEMMDDFFPFMKKKEGMPAQLGDKSQQRWPDHREMI